MAFSADARQSLETLCPTSRVVFVGPRRTCSRKYSSSLRLFGRFVSGLTRGRGVSFHDPRIGSGGSSPSTVPCVHSVDVWQVGKLFRREEEGGHEEDLSVGCGELDWKTITPRWRREGLTS